MSTPEVYIGRQPILDRRQKVAGYELLFRSSRENFCFEVDPVIATSQVIVNAVLGLGLDRLLGGKPAFINFNRALLLGDWTTLLPPDKVIIEILETVPPDSDVLFACHRLRQQGYTLALDDCLDDGRTAAFAPFVDILKVDFQGSSPADQEKLVARYRKLNLMMLAEKVETHPQFRSALQWGYDYFQGYFFAHPTVLEATRIPSSQINCLRLLQQVQREELNFRAIEDLIRHDVAFSHSLLTYLNSAAFDWAQRVESIRQGLLLMGSDELRKWGWIASLSSVSKARPAVLIEQALMRGRFCELIACSSDLHQGGADFFLMGMFSLLDALLGRSLAAALDDLNIHSKIRDALLGTAGEADILSLVLRIVQSYEVGNWNEVTAAASVIGLSADALNRCYLQSLSWVETVSPPEEQKRPADFFRRETRIARSPFDLRPGRNSV